MSESAPGYIEAFLCRVESSPDSVAVEIEGEGPALTYADLLALTERYRATFLANGVGPGDPVLVALPPGPDLIACFFALSSVSALAVLVNEFLTPFELDPILSDVKPKGAVTSNARIAAALVSRSLGRFLLWAGEDAIDPQGTHVSLVSLGRARSPLSPPEGNPTVTCHFTYKGLGYPLGVLHAYDSYARSVKVVTDRHLPSAGETHLAALPMYPVYGLITAVLMPLLAGARVLVVKKIGSRDLYDVLADNQVRMACVVPVLLRSLTTPRPKPKPFHERLEVITGGAYLTPELARQVKEAVGLEVHQCYGLTETLAISSTFFGGNVEGAIGRPLSTEIQVACVDARGRRLPPGRTGEIRVASPTLMRGFLNRPAETARFLRDGRFHTGDLGHIDKDGMLFFDGRALPFTKCAAQMVDLREIELLLLRHPKIADVRATVQAERIAVAVVLQRGASMAAEEVTAFCSLHLSKHKVPRLVKLYERAIQSVAVNQ